LERSMNSTKIAYLDDFRARGPNTAVSAAGNLPSGRNLPGAATSLMITEPKWEELTLRRIDRLSKLASNWDGSGAKPMDQFTSQFGIKLLHALLPSGAPAPAISLSRYGGIQFEWYNDRFELEIEIEGPYRVSSLFYNKDTDEQKEHRFDYEYSRLKSTFVAIFSENGVSKDESSAA
jgi:hypothetical protein